MKDPGDIIFWRRCRRPIRSRCARRLIATVEGVRAKPITAVEVDRVRAKGVALVRRDVQRSAEARRRDLESIATGDWRLLFLQRDQWRKLTPADVQRVAQDYLKPSNRTLGQFIPDAKPDRAPTPPAADIAALVKDYKGDPSVAAGESFEPTPANLEAARSASRSPTE
jgi:zinc protease